MHNERCGGAGDEDIDLSHSPPMSSRNPTPAERIAAKKKLSVAIAAAQKKADTAKRSAKRAKAGYKRAKQKFKNARRAAKKLRKVVKSLKAEFALLTEKRTRRRTAGARPAPKSVVPESLPSAPVGVPVENSPIPDEMPPAAPPASGLPA